MAFTGQRMLITGGAGFVGSNLAVWFKTHFPDLQVVALDNLKRRGSELNLPRLRACGVTFVHGDVRSPEDLTFATRASDAIDTVIECSAEPSVLAGYDGASSYLVNTNLLGTVHCLELARRVGATFVFLSTSRVYPIDPLNAIATIEEESRFALAPTQTLPGLSAHGIAESFPLTGARSLYGTTKLASELLITEYRAMYGLRTVVNRCGVLTGPWQMGKVDQGVFALWMARHYFGGELGYIGWGGRGKQVRDLLHVDDLAALVAAQLARLDTVDGRTFNVGGGVPSSLSLRETTALCQEITGRRIPVRETDDTRPADIKLYLSDYAAVTQATGWRPQYTPHGILASMFSWLREADALVRPLWT